MKKSSSYSHSRLDAYEKCPRSFKLQYKEKRPEPRSAPKLIGSAVHAGIAGYMNHLVEECLQTDITWDLMPAARAGMDGEGERLAPEEWDEVASILSTFKEAFMLDPETVVTVERMEEFYINNAGGFPDHIWRAKIDLFRVIDGAARVTDWKSSWAIASQAEVEKDRQLHHYGWTVNRITGYEEVVVELYYPRHGVSREVRLGKADFEKTDREIAEAVAAIEVDTEFNPSPGAHCSWCSWADDCPAVSDLPVLVATTEDAARVAGEILVLEQRVKERKEALKPWCTVNGHVRLGGEVFGHLPAADPESGWNITDIQVFMDRLRAHGMDPWNYVSVSGTKLKSLRTAKKYAPVKADLEDIMERNIKTSFTHRKDDAA